MSNGKWDIADFPIITELEFANDLDAVLERIDKKEGPFRIINDDGNSLILMEWDEYWRKFGVLYPDGERERIEEECRKLNETNRFV